MSVLTSMFGRAFGAVPSAGRLEKDEDFVDISLPITNHRWTKDNTLVVVARGKVDGKVVSLSVDFGAEWKAQKVENASLTVYWGKGHIVSVGNESDNFVSLLAGAYGIATNSKMRPRTDVTMVSLGSDPRELRTTPAKIKIFFESGGESSYGEAFINVDLSASALEFRDKDPEYHNGIIASLGAGT
jgi:hypothetical protein